MLNVIPGVESILWKHTVLKQTLPFLTTCGNLIDNVDQQHDLQRLKHEKQVVFLQPRYVGIVV